MKLVDATIENYRCFRHLHIDFDQRLTVIVGTNGSGKTALLEALALILERCIFDVTRSFSFRMPASHIKFGECESSLAATFSISDLNTPVKVVLPYRNEGIDGSATIQNASGFGPLIDFYKKAFEGASAIPVLVYYHAKRSWENKASQPSQVHSEKKAAFENAFGSLIDYSTSRDWFIAKSSEEAIKAHNTKNLDFSIPELDAVRQAIVQALGEYDSPYVDNTPAEILITSRKAPEEFLRLDQLSAGYHTMLALVMDLARRMAIANGGGQFGVANVLHAPGIVLIDEIEVHLHPKWQQDVLPRLLQIFPNVQFIVSTHSAPVVTSVKPDQLRILSDGDVTTPAEPTYGAETGSVLQDIFGTPPRPDNKLTRMLRNYLDLVSAGEGLTEKGLALKNQLLVEMPNDPDLARASQLLALEEMRKQGDL